MVYSFVFHAGVLGIADVVLNFYFVSLGYDRESIALLQSLTRVGGFVTSLPVGLLTNRIGAYRLLLLATLGLAAVHGVYIHLTTLPVLLVSQFLLGFFYSAQQIALVPLMLTLVGRAHETRFFALHNVVSMIGMAAGSLAGGLLPGLLAALATGSPAAATAAQTPLAYGLALMSAGLLTLVGLLPLLWMRPRRQPAPEVAAPVLRAALTRGVWVYIVLLTLPMLTFGFTGGLTFPFYNLFFRTQYGIDDQVVGLIMSIGWVGMALVPLLNPWLERHFGRVGGIAVTMAVAAVAFVWLGGTTELVTGVVAFVIAVSFRNVMLPIYQPLLMSHLAPSLHGVANSMVLIMWNIGWFSATSVSGTWQITRGFGFIMGVVAAGVLLNAVIVVLVFRGRTLYQPALEAGG